jgi:HIV Tat-specific factor 1
VYENHPEGVVMVKFKDKQAGLKCIQIMNGRWYGFSPCICMDVPGSLEIDLLLSIVSVLSRESANDELHVGIDKAQKYICQP